MIAKKEIINNTQVNVFLARTNGMFDFRKEVTPILSPFSASLEVHKENRVQARDESIWTDKYFARYNSKKSS